MNDHRVFYRRSTRPFPETSTTLIHLHGVGMSGTYMTPTADALAADYRSFVPDLPGFGRSAKTGVPPTIEGLAKSTIDFMDTLHIQTATLIGNSMGCMTILEIAYRYPERIAAAVLCSPGRPVYQPLARGILQVMRLTMREPLSMLPILVHDYVRCGIRDGLSLYHSMVQFPTWSRFLRLSVPSLIVIGAKDPLLFESEVNRLSKRKGRIEVVTIPGAGHTMNYSHPRQTAAAIKAFVDEQQSADTGGVQEETSNGASDDVHRVSRASQGPL